MTLVPRPRGPPGGLLAQSSQHWLFSGDPLQILERTVPGHQSSGTAAHDTHRQVDTHRNSQHTTYIHTRTQGNSTHAHRHRGTQTHTETIHTWAHTDTTDTARTHNSHTHGHSKRTVWVHRLHPKCPPRPCPGWRGHLHAAPRPLQILRFPELGTNPGLPDEPRWPGRPPKFCPWSKTDPTDPSCHVGTDEHREGREAVCRKEELGHEFLW